MRRTALTALAAAMALLPAAPAAAKSYAQELVDQTLARHPEIVVLGMHVTPPTASENVIIASNIGRIGKKADEDDLAVIKTGTAKLEVNKTGDRFETELVLQDVSGDTIGALGVVFAYKAGDDQAALAKRAEAIRDELKRHISNVANLVEPYPFVEAAPARIYAQTLIDGVMDKHPDVIISALHVAPPGSQNYMIAGSNIGRIGKPADEDDMNVIKTGKPNLEANSTGKRFEVELVCQDQAGHTIGAFSAVFAYKEGDDKQALAKRAEAIRDELKPLIPSAAKLFEPAK